jgi:hypothetical protein
MAEPTAIAADPDAALVARLRRGDEDAFLDLSGARMTCQELVELVTDYFDGALDEPARAEFEAHLAVCPGCDSYVEQMRATMRMAHDAKALEESPEVAGLLAAFRDWRITRR